MRRAADKAIIGMTVFMAPTADKSWKWSYLVYTGRLGPVHNKECKLLLLQYAFETLQYNRVEFKVAGQNLRSQKALKK